MRIERLSELNGRAETKGEFALYWMRKALRAESNPALDWIIQRANALGIPPLVIFSIPSGYIEGSPTRYRYLLGGLDEVRSTLKDKGIRFVIAPTSSAMVMHDIGLRSALIVTDAGYLREDRAWLADLARVAPCRVVGIEGNVVVPSKIASDKEEWSAYTLRRRIMPHLDTFLETQEEQTPRKSAFDIELPLHYGDGTFPEQLTLNPEAIGRIAEQESDEVPGTKSALSRFEDFLRQRLDHYAKVRNDPNHDGTSRMSAALHFGQISPVELVTRTLRAVGERRAEECRHEGAAAYIEELVVRRELAANMTTHRDDYDSPACLPQWARKTLDEGALHPREKRYSFAELENARTEDPYWNAAQDQMVLTGWMHGYMRMYWGKRLLAWTSCPEAAWRVAVTLNDKYSLDGRDPNGYAGIAWCFGKHDRPWIGRPIYGTMRYMNAKGLKRKFDADAYVRHIRMLKEAACSTI